MNFIVPQIKAFKPYEGYLKEETAEYSENSGLQWMAGFHDMSFLSYTSMSFFGISTQRYFFHFFLCSHRTFSNLWNSEPTEDDGWQYWKLEKSSGKHKMLYVLHPRQIIVRFKESKERAFGIFVYGKEIGQLWGSESKSGQLLDNEEICFLYCLTFGPEEPWTPGEPMSPFGPTGPCRGNHGKINVITTSAIPPLCSQSRQQSFDNSRHHL